MKVIISNGHFKFILGAVAAELHKREMLKLFITTGYPTPTIKFIDRIFSTSSKWWSRLLDRKENVPNDDVRAMWLSEFIQKLAVIFFTAGSSKYYAWYGLSLKLYSKNAKHLINKTDADIYHYRAGYGRESIIPAKEKGMITICDHSLVHPRVLNYLIENGGKLPPITHSPEITRFWAEVELDIDQADFVIVNSSFVKETFLNRGWDPDRVFVAYTGLDDGLIDSKPTRKVVIDNSDCIHFQFAGEGVSRKGLPDLLRAFQGIKDYPWKLSIVGDIHQNVLDEFDDFLHDLRITLIPFCSRHDLLSEMGLADVFIFPSLAEGSARVVFMAMAMGCYIITTENSGSVVRDGVNGAIVKPGDVEGLRKAIRYVFGKKELLNEICFNNIELIKKKYTQADYGARIVEIYEDIILNQADK